MVVPQKKRNKMARLRVRNKILEAVGLFMLEKGRVLSRHEYDEYANEVPMGSGMALNHFGSWSRLTTTLEGTFPDLWAEIQKAGSVNTEEVFEAPEEICEVCGENCGCAPGECNCAKPDPLAALAKVSEVKENDE